MEHGLGNKELALNFSPELGRGKLKKPGKRKKNRKKQTGIDVPKNTDPGPANEMTSSNLCAWTAPDRRGCRCAGEAEVSGEASFSAPPTRPGPKRDPHFPSGTCRSRDLTKAQAVKRYASLSFRFRCVENGASMVLPGFLLGFWRTSPRQ